MRLVKQIKISEFQQIYILFYLLSINIVYYKRKSEILLFDFGKMVQFLKNFKLPKFTLNNY